MRRRLIILGLASYALALLFTAPASLLDTVLDRASDGRLRLAEARGSLWSGEGLLEIREAGKGVDHRAAGKTALAKSIAWRLQPQFLLLGQFNCEIRLDRAEKPILVTMFLTRSEVEVTEADIRLPASALALVMPRLAALRLGGEMTLHIAHLSMASQGMKGDATLLWRGASSALTSVSPLGDYQVRLDDEGRGISLTSLQGPLLLDGKASWAKGGKPVFQATARVPPQHLQQLAPLLRLIAVERGEGKFELQLR